MNTNAIVQWVENKSFSELFESGFLSSYATRHLNKHQKAAVFLITIGLDTASQILRHLPEDEIEKISRVILETRQVSQAMTTAVLDELEHSIQEPNYSGGEPYAQALLNKALGPRASQRIMGQVKVAGQIGHLPFARLRQADPALLRSLLSQESPQTIALVLSHLPAQLAGEILSALPREQQGDIVQRMADTQAVAPEILQALEDGLWQKFQALNGQGAIKVKGLNVVSSVLNHTRSDVRERILSQVEKDDQALAQRIREAMFTFDDLVLLTDNAIQLLIRTVDRQALACALKGAAEPVRQKFFGNMSQRAAALFRENISALPPTPRAEVHARQQAIVETVRQLEKDGKILISRGSDEWVE